MAGSQGVELCVAVCEAGGLGSIPSALLSPAILRDQIAEIRARTPAPFNVNFFCHEPPGPDPDQHARWLERLAGAYAEAGLDPSAAGSGPGRAPFDAAMAEVVEATKPPVGSFHFGLPDGALLARVKAAGAKIYSSATTVAEARWLEAHGVDAVIAQGAEAGGHRGMFLSEDIADSRAWSRCCLRSSTRFAYRSSRLAGSPTDGAWPPLSRLAQAQRKLARHT